jgi:hypothetical protein
VPTETLADGRQVTWTSHGVCYCTSCKEVFNSVSAFDHHLKRGRRGQGGHARHDTSGMPRNAKGYLVRALRSPHTWGQERSAA